jgi:beta-N-acetylhexosaminidase
MINTIINKAKKVFVISTRNPYDYLVLDNVKNYLALYEYTPNSVQTIVDYLAGNITLAGKIPITLSRHLMFLLRFMWVWSNIPS